MTTSDDKRIGKYLNLVSDKNLIREKNIQNVKQFIYMIYGICTKTHYLNSRKILIYELFYQIYFTENKRLLENGDSYWYSRRLIADLAA